MCENPSRSFVHGINSGFNSILPEIPIPPVGWIGTSVVSLNGVRIIPIGLYFISSINSPDKVKNVINPFLVIKIN